MDLQADLIDRTAMEIRDKKAEVCVWTCSCVVDGWVGVPDTYATCALKRMACALAVCVRGRARTLHIP